MKKLAFDSSNWKLIGTINDLIDLVNSQQEAIERLQEHVDHEARHVSEPADDKPESKVWTADFIEKYRPALENLAKAGDTHRTVTLRIPKGMGIVEAIEEAYQDTVIHTDTDLQKALDEVEGEHNE